eukprot:9368421-Pyramimonas_sp.AAC.1
MAMSITRYATACVAALACSHLGLSTSPTTPHPDADRLYDDLEMKTNQVEHSGDIHTNPFSFRERMRNNASTIPQIDVMS